MPGGHHPAYRSCTWRPGPLTTTLVGMLTGEEGLDRRPDGVDRETVEAVGKLSEAFETIEEARGRLIGFHRLIGSGDLALGDAVEMLRKAGHPELADQIDTELVGRNVLQGRWTFQVLEEFEDGYYADFRRWDARARDELMGGRRHVYEAEMKIDRRTDGLPGHEETPGGTA